MAQQDLDVRFIARRGKGKLKFSLADECAVVSTRPGARPAHFEMIVLDPRGLEVEIAASDKVKHLVTPLRLGSELFFYDQGKLHPYRDQAGLYEDPEEKDSYLLYSFDGSNQQLSAFAGRLSHTHRPTISSVHDTPAAKRLKRVTKIDGDKELDRQLKLFLEVFGLTDQLSRKLLPSGILVTLELASGENRFDQSQIEFLKRALENTDAFAEALLTSGLFEVTVNAVAINGIPYVRQLGARLPWIGNEIDLSLIIGSGLSEAGKKTFEDTLKMLRERRPTI